MTYDIDAIKRKIAQLSNPRPSKAKSDDKVKLAWFKPGLVDTVDIRFLPYDDGNGQPIQQIDYYTSKELYKNRLVAPVQWGLPDPIADLNKELSKDRQNDATWALMKHLRLKESYYAPVLVRGQEEKGVQIWELNQKCLNQLYAILAHPDYADEYLFDPVKGYDFTLTTTDSGKTVNFGGKDYPVRDYDIQCRRKPSPLASNAAQRQKLVDSVPELSDHFKQFVMAEDRLKEVVVNFLSTKNGGSPSTNDEDIDFGAGDENVSKATSKIDDAFSDLDD